MREAYAKEANDAGHEAFRRGRPRGANPNQRGTLEWWAFDVGWRCEQNLVEWERNQFKTAAAE